jgi:protein gp37
MSGAKWVDRLGRWRPAAPDQDLGRPAQMEQEGRPETGYRPRVFCASLADVFDNEVDQAWRDDLWQLLRETPNLRWILLTKRIGNAPRCCRRTGRSRTPA